MDKPKITILVAVYNAEQYLGKCLDSLIGQSLKDIQIICIDDCSTDNSLNILNEYAENDSRITVVRQDENRGQAVARNRGLELAEGEYTTMLDSDDWMDDDSLRLVYDSLKENDADCALFDLIMVYPDREENYAYRTDKQVFTGEEAFRLSMDWSIHGLYAIRTDIHKDYPFDTSCRLYSDDNTSHLHFLHSNKVVRTAGRYYYRIHGQSMTNAVDILHFEHMNANMSMKRQLESEIEKGSITDGEEVLNDYEAYRMKVIVDACWYLFNHKNDFTQEERKAIEEKIRFSLSTIEPKRIKPREKMKLGYYPFKSYKVFKLQENTYFWLKKLIKRH